MKSVCHFQEVRSLKCEICLSLSGSEITEMRNPAAEEFAPHQNCSVFRMSRNRHFLKHFHGVYGRGKLMEYMAGVS